MVVKILEEFKEEFDKFNNKKVFEVLIKFNFKNKTYWTLILSTIR